MTTQVYRVYIKATPEAIWDAITDPDWTEKYGYGGRAEFDLRPGGAFKGFTSEAIGRWARRTSQSTVKSSKPTDRESCSDVDDLDDTTGPAPRARRAARRRSGPHDKDVYRLCYVRGPEGILIGAGRANRLTPKRARASFANTGPGEGRM